MYQFLCLDRVSVSRLDHVSVMVCIIFYSDVLYVQFVEQFLCSVHTGLHGAIYHTCSANFVHVSVPTLIRFFSTIRF
jgi:hypothetical protein